MSQLKSEAKKCLQIDILEFSENTFDNSFFDFPDNA